MKKYIKYIILAALIIGLIFTKGNLFKLIDLVVVCPIANILFFIYNFIGDFGLAVILFVVLVKFLMWPLTKRQFYQTKLMRKLQPELAEIRKNCNGNKQLESLQTMDLYKRHNIKPFRSILTIFIQLPIFIALYTAIRVMTIPTVADNLNSRAYSFIKFEGSRVSQVIDLQETYFAAKTEDSSATYDFDPKLFNLIPLGDTANDVMRGNFSIGVIFALACAIAAATMQYFVAKQQNPSSTGKKKKFRDLMKETSSGKEIDQSDVTAMTTSQMSFMMPLMLFLIMFNLPGALAFYYFLSNAISFSQQRYIFKKSNQEMDDMTDRHIVRELKKIEEAEIITNKKTGTKITVSKPNNKKRR